MLKKIVEHWSKWFRSKNYSNAIRLSVDTTLLSDWLYTCRTQFIFFRYFFWQWKVNQKSKNCCSYIQLIAIRSFMKFEFWLKLWRCFELTTRRIHDILKKWRWYEQKLRVWNQCPVITTLPSKWHGWQRFADFPTKTTQ